jgi:alpha,alpha-trehalase
LAATARSSLEGAARAKVVVITETGVETRTVERQWEYPNGWAPHQMLAWAGLRKHGFELDAKRLSYEWLFTIVKNAAEHHGTVPEKYDVERRSHGVFAEYGNVNADFAYITEEGFGWMNASFVVGWAGLDAAHRDALRRLEPPERVFSGR